MSSPYKLPAPRSISWATSRLPNRSGFGYFSLSLPSFLLSLFWNLPLPREKLSSPALCGFSQATVHNSATGPTGNRLILHLCLLIWILLLTSSFPEGCSFRSSHILSSRVPAEDEQGRTALLLCSIMQNGCLYYKAFSATSILHKILSPRLVQLKCWLWLFPNRDTPRSRILLYYRTEVDFF